MEMPAKHSRCTSRRVPRRHSGKRISALLLFRQIAPLFGPPIQDPRETAPMSESTTSFDAAALARSLADTRKAGGRRPAADFAVPPDLDAVMETQAALAKLHSDSVKGWKMGLREGAAILAPMYPIYPTLELPFSAGLGLEPEICVVLGADLPPVAGGYTRAEIVAAISAIHIGIEPITGRLAEGNKAPFPLFLADGLANEGYVLGARVPEALEAAIRAGVTQLDMPITFSGSAVEAKTYAGVHPFGDPLAPLVAYANAQTDKLGGLKAGQIITTGSFCGAPAVLSKGEATIDLNGTAITLTIV
jgi:2-keto-4-pentenoate hydratase